MYTLHIVYKWIFCCFFSFSPFSFSLIGTWLCRQFSNTYKTANCFIVFFFFLYTHWFIINTLQNVDAQLWTVRLYYVFGLSLKFDRTSVRYGMETRRNSKWPNCLKNVPLKYTQNFAFTSSTIFPISVKTDFFELIYVIGYNLPESVTTT